MLASVIIRTYNEEKHLDELLSSVKNQKTRNFEVEIVIVDSGSSDNTLPIAEKYDCRITHIKKSEFTYGRSLNIGCEFSGGDYLVFVSGHCVPVDENWLEEIISPLMNGQAMYSYGRQLGRDSTKFSECRHFEKWFPDYSKIPQEGFFCNNANAALARSAWNQFRFNEDLTGLEDMYLAKQIVESGENIAYVSSAGVYHIHEESWIQVKIRYEREAYALQQIMPEMHFGFLDFIYFFITGIYSDLIEAFRQRKMMEYSKEIICFRFCHYWGTYKGNHEHRKLSEERKKNYFYPKDLEKKDYA